VRLPQIASLLAALGAVALGACACGEPAAAARPALVFAASSLTSAFEEMERELEAAHPGSGIELHFDGSSRLVVQVREGARADVFASADAANMQKLVDARLTAAPPRVFASNRLAIVAGKGNPQGIAGLADLARADLRVALCGPEVPAGRYARAALAKAKVTVRSVSDEPNVKAVVSKVQLGEIDAGIVYATDATADVTAIAIPDERNVVATYPIAPLSAGASRATGDAFIAFVLSPAGQRILRAHGFGGP
jgi:molybdate transport system substrate-binding protein